MERFCKFDPALEPDMARHCSKGRPHWHDKAPALTQREAGLRLSVTVAPFKFTKAAACRGTVTVTSRVVVFRDIIASGGWLCRDIAGCSSVARLKSDIATEAAWGPKLPSSCGSHGLRPGNEPASDLTWPLDARCGRTMACSLSHWQPAHYRNGLDSTRVPICDRS